MNKALLVYTTFPDADIALAVGESLVRDRLIACANVLPGIALGLCVEGGGRARG